jgi:hypothetical protein
MWNTNLKIPALTALPAKRFEKWLNRFRYTIDAAASGYQNKNTPMPFCFSGWRFL